MVHVLDHSNRYISSLKIRDLHILPFFFRHFLNNYRQYSLTNCYLIIILCMQTYIITITKFFNYPFGEMKKIYNIRSSQSIIK